MNCRASPCVRTSQRVVDVGVERRGLGHLFAALGAVAERQQRHDSGLECTISSRRPYREGLLGADTDTSPLPVWLVIAVTVVDVVVKRVRARSIRACNGPPASCSMSTIKRRLSASRSKTRSASPSHTLVRSTQLGLGLKAREIRPRVGYGVTTMRLGDGSSAARSRSQFTRLIAETSIGGLPRAPSGKQGRVPGCARRNRVAPG